MSDDQVTQDQDTRSPAGLFNIVTAALLALSIVACFAAIAAVLTWPRAAAPTIVDEAPTLIAGIPTFTPGPDDPTPGATATMGEIIVASSTPTLALTLGPVNTVTEPPPGLPTATPTLTETPTPSPTPQFTATPVPTSTNTPSPFDYVLRNGSLTYTANFANTAGCSWAGIAGAVYDVDGRHVAGLRVHVYGAGIDERITTGSFTDYGDSGWERSVDAKPNTNVYFVQLESPTGDLLSDVITVQMVDNCNQNLVLVNFDQVNP